MFKKKNLYPVKTTLNLVIKERSPRYYQATVLGSIAAVVVIGLFTKFAVVDVLSSANELARQAQSDRAEYEQLLVDNTIYSDVRVEYDKYFTTVNDGEGIADCMNVLWLIENNIMTKAAVQSAALSEGKLSVVLTGIDLEQASVVVNDLYTNELVSSVSVSSADTTVKDTYSSVSMSIQLITEGGEDKQ